MEPFIGSEAVASGDLTRGQLRWRYQRLHPDVYIVPDRVPDSIARARAAWLWSRRSGIVAGLTAASLHGVCEIDGAAPVELIGAGRHAPRGIVIRNEKISRDEIETIAGLPVTTPARTAVDLARHLPRNEAVVVLDQLAAIGPVDGRNVDTLVNRYRGTRGMAEGRSALRLMDGRTRNPKETRLRLVLHDAGFPKPRTRIELEDGHQTAVLGLGWPRFKVGLSVHEEDDSGNPYRLVQQVRRDDLIQRLRWIEMCVLDSEPRQSIVHRTRSMLLTRRP